MHLLRDQIERVRVRARRSSAGLRRAVSHQLETLELRPPGMPPSSILLVRTIDDPAPGKLSASPGHHRVPPRWERALQHQLSVCFRRAARPMRSAVPSGAEAVWFADEAELAACLAIDLARGRAADRWWWQLLSRSWAPTAMRDVTSVLEWRVHQLPAIVAHLDEANEAVPVLSQLAGDRARRLLVGVAAAHELHLVRAWLDGSDTAHVLDSERASDEIGTAAEPAASSDMERTRPDDGDPARPSARSTDRPSSASVDPPPRAGGRAAPDPRRATRALIRVCLAIHRDPAYARSSSLVAALVADQRAAPATPRHDQRTGRTTLTSEPAPRARLAADSGSRGKARVPVQHSTDVATDPAIERDQLPGDHARRGEPHRSSGTPDAARPHSSADAESPPGTAIAEPTQAAELPDGVATELGGLFYLVNLIAHVDLSAAFDADWRLEDQLGGWGVVELVGRTLLRDVGSVDPVWQLLAELAGRRPDQPLGLGFEAPEMPDAHLDSDPLAAWAALARPLLCDRLRRACAPHEVEPHDLLRCSARIYASRTHVDIVAALDQISMPARMAGLDRDPGWVAVLNRIILFHFE